MRNFVKAVFIGVIVLSAVTVVHAQNLPPRPQQAVNDFAGVLSVHERQQVEMLSRELAQKADAYLVVATVKSVKPETGEQYAVRLFEHWGIGQRGKDNGILLLMAVNDREVRIEVGYGLEGVLTDAVSRSIIEKFMVPAFRQQLYGQGLSTGAAAIASVVAQSKGVTVTGREAQVVQTLQKEEEDASAISFFIFAVFVLLFALNPRLFLYTLLFSSMGGRRGYWSGSSGGFGGGFGGFGGGMSGGGGASGRW